MSTVQPPPYEIDLEKEREEIISRYKGLLRSIRGEPGQLRTTATIQRPISPTCMRRHRHLMHLIIAAIFLYRSGSMRQGVRF